MPLTISYDQWIKETSSFGRSRSKELKDLDFAIKGRNEVMAKHYLTLWIDAQNKKRQDWHRSARNSKGTVEKLYKELGVLGSAVSYQNIGAEMDDKMAKAHIRREQRLAAAKMFTGKELRFKAQFWSSVKQKSQHELSKMEKAKRAYGIGSSAASTAKEIKGIADNIKTVIQALTDSLPPETANKVVVAILGQSAATFAQNAAPVIGLVSSGIGVVKEWVGVARNIQSKQDMASREVDIRLGDPQAALQAIQAIIEREIKRGTADASIKTAAFGGKVAGVAADLGTGTTAAIGAIESTALLLSLLADVVIDVKQLKAGNQLISEGKIDLDLFKECPILGCYYIVIQDHSTIMNFDIENMGKQNWQQEAERLKYAIKPVISKASDLIKASRIEIIGMESAKGVYQRGLVNKIKIFYKSKGYGLNPNNRGISSDDQVLDDFIFGG